MPTANLSCHIVNRRLCLIILLMFLWLLSIDFVFRTRIRRFRNFLIFCWNNSLTKLVDINEKGRDGFESFCDIFHRKMFSEEFSIRYETFETIENANFFVGLLISIFRTFFIFSWNWGWTGCLILLEKERKKEKKEFGNLRGIFNLQEFSHFSYCIEKYSGYFLFILCRNNFKKFSGILLEWSFEHFFFWYYGKNGFANFIRIFD